MQRFVALDSWRGICALLVACYHFEALSNFYGNPLVRDGYLFVDFFFVLSGFVIASAYGGRLSTREGVGRFLVLRLGRVWPLHVALLALFIVTEAAFSHFVSDFSMTGRQPFTGPYSVGSIFTNLMLVHSWGFEPMATWNGPSWSISTEFFAYLVFAAVAFLARGWHLAVMLFLMLTLPFVNLVLHLQGYDDAMQFGTLRCLLGFATGTIVYSLWKLLHARYGAWLAAHAGGATGIEVLAVLLTVGFVVTPQTPVTETIAPFAFGLTVLAFGFDAGWISRLLRLRPFALLGTLSYSIYMVHLYLLGRIYNFGHLLEKVIGTPVFSTVAGEPGHVQIGTTLGQGNLWYAVMLTAVVATSWVTFRTIEAPMRERSRRLADVLFGKAVRPVPAPMPVLAEGPVAGSPGLALDRPQVVQKA